MLVGPGHWSMPMPGSILCQRVGGSLIDVVINMWAVSARTREHARLAASFRTEADAQRNSWMYREKAASSTTSRFGRAGGMLAWAVRQLVANWS
ncbi:hypothetical protein X748_08820 [Mesorhizobium sp. LNJC386A00]|nr:hypothetical protein X748_08820 [Mesorhizobium sp. LNJC386A00]